MSEGICACMSCQQATFNVFSVWVRYCQAMALTCFSPCPRACTLNQPMMAYMSSQALQREWVVIFNISVQYFISSWHAWTIGCTCNLHNNCVFCNPHVIQWLSLSLFQSLADRCKKIHAGDEVIQVNHQTVVSVSIVHNHVTL